MLKFGSIMLYNMSDDIGRNVLLGDISEIFELKKSVLIL
jgi:hypothetical protein